MLSKAGKGSAEAITGLAVLGEPTAEFMGMGAIKATRATNPACNLENNLIGDTDGRKGRKVIIFVESSGGSRLWIGMFGFKYILNSITCNVIRWGEKTGRFNGGYVLDGLAEFALLNQCIKTLIALRGGGVTLSGRQEVFH